VEESLLSVTECTPGGGTDVKYIQLSTVPLRLKWLKKSLNDKNHQTPIKLQHTDSLCLRSISFFIAGLSGLRRYCLSSGYLEQKGPVQDWIVTPRGELSYLAPLGSENISAPYFKQCFFQGRGGITPQTVKHHASQSQDRNNKYFILYFNFASIIKFKM